MIVSGYTSTAQTNGTSQADLQQAERKSAASAGPVADQTGLSADSSRAQSLTDSLNQVPDVRADRVAQVSQQIQSGNYSVSNDQIAQGILNET